MNDPSNPASARDSARTEEIERLEQMLNEGLDDLDAGRTVSRDESRLEIEKILGPRQLR